MFTIPQLNADVTILRFCLGFCTVLMGYEEYESLLETLNILSDPATMVAFTEAERDLAAGNLVDLI